jgi:hypothetical protein
VATGVIDQDAAHDLRGDTKEMRPILPVDLPLVDEPDKHLVHKRRRLQGVAGPLAPKLAGRHAPELRIDEWQQLVERSPVAATPIAEQCRDVSRRDHRTLLNKLDRRPRA